MRIDKTQIIEFLKDHGKQDQADAAQQTLPEKVDTDEHDGLLVRHGISVEELLRHFGDGKLGKLL